MKTSAILVLTFAIALATVHAAPAAAVDKRGDTVEPEWDESRWKKREDTVEPEWDESRWKKREDTAKPTNEDPRW
ncbi:hypothetical protein BGX23_002315 [Mortierella sp. AD031]|nr:hypothetical protein BGX23_002315 [Mortierella sp. AD031]